MPQLIKGIRPMHIAFFVTLIVIIVVAVTLAVVLSINNEQEKVPSITVSLYVGDIDEPKNGRRKRATGDDECMRLEDVKYTVRDILSKLAQEGNVQKVRFLTYSDASYITEAMPLDMGISQLANIVMLRDGKAPKQSSSMQKFNDVKQQNEDLVHYMPCSTDYDGYEDDVKQAGESLKQINGDKHENKVTLISRTMDTDEIQTAFGLQPDDVHIVDKDVPTEDIAGTVSDYVGDDLGTTRASTTATSTTITTTKPQPTKPTDAPPDDKTTILPIETTTEEQTTTGKTPPEDTTTRIPSTEVTPITTETPATSEATTEQPTTGGTVITEAPTTGESTATPDHSSDPAITFSFYIGSIGEPESHARRKRDTGDECMHFVDVQQTINDTLSGLIVDGNVKSVRFITYSETPQVFDPVPLLDGIANLLGMTFEKEEKDISQSSSLDAFNSVKQPNEDLIHYMPCSMDYPSYDADVQNTTNALKEINKDKTGNQVTLVSRTMNESEIKETFSLADDEVKIIDKDVPQEDIAGNVTDIIEKDLPPITTAAILQTTTELPSTEGSPAEASTEQSTTIPSEHSKTAQPATDGTPATPAEASTEQSTTIPSEHSTSSQPATDGTPAEASTSLSSEMSSMASQSTPHPGSSPTEVTPSGYMDEGLTTSEKPSEPTTAFTISQATTTEQGRSSQRSSDETRQTEGATRSTTEEVATTTETPRPPMSVLFINDFTTDFVGDEDQAKDRPPLIIRLADFGKCPAGLYPKAGKEFNFTADVVDSVRQAVNMDIYFFEYRGMGDATPIDTEPIPRDSFKEEGTEILRNACFDGPLISDFDSFANQLGAISADILVWFSASEVQIKNNMPDLSNFKRVIGVGLDGANFTTNLSVAVNSDEFSESDSRTIACMIDTLWDDIDSMDFSLCLQSLTTAQPISRRRLKIRPYRLVNS